jgi:enoyl-CoA hydratase/carnithine racemase
MQITQTENLRIDRDGGLLRLTITRPARMNAIDLAGMTELSNVLTETATDSSVRVVVLTGDGKAFCTGADLAAGSQTSPEGVMDTASRMIRSVTTLPVPVIARINGPAAGLITKALPDDQLDAHVEAVAVKLANGPRRALGLTKAAVNAATVTELDAALERETVGQIELQATPDFFEGATAMLTRRKPNFGS